MRYFGILTCLVRGHDWQDKLETQNGLAFPLLTCRRCKRHP